MWNNYFYNIQKKYSMRLSLKEPLVIRLDGKNITKNNMIDLMNISSSKSFMYAMRESVKHFTSKYKCYSIYGSDEVSFIFIEPMKLMRDLDSDSDNHSNEIISLFSQYFFNYFNNFDKNKIVFFHAKCFSIPNEKVTSYIKYRSRVIENVMVTYFLKKECLNQEILKLDDKIDKCKQMPNYYILEEIKRGMLYYSGRQIGYDEFLNGDIVYKENIKEEQFSELF